MHDLGRQLKLLRTGRAMSQREVAQAAGIAPSLLSRIESGKHDFKHSSIKRVLEVLGAEINLGLRKERPMPDGAYDNEKGKETADTR